MALRFHPFLWRTQLLNVQHGDTRTMCQICSNLIKTPERCQRRRFGVVIVDFEKISQIVLGFPLLTFSKYMPAG